MDDTREELLRLNQRLLDAIARADWPTYQELCHPSLTAVESESLGQCVEGLAFHQFYFAFGGASAPAVTTMTNPHVRLMGDSAVLTYVRLNQRTRDSLPAATTGVAETRVWQRIGGRWRHVHFHRSPLGG